MALQYSLDAVNAALDAKMACLGPAAVLKVFSGLVPRNCGAPDPAGLLVTIDLPHPFMSKAVNAIVRKSGDWKGTVSGQGKAASFRICGKNGACHIQGKVSTGADGELVVKRVDLAPDQAFIVDSFSIKAAVG